MSHVTNDKGRRTKLSRYVEKVADLMELRDWRIILSGDSPPGGAIGHNTTVYGRKLSTIKLGVEAYDDPETLRHVIVHELVHCHMDPAHVMIQRDLEAFLSGEVDKAFYMSFRRAAEYAVDGIATALAKFMPLPPP